MKNKTETPQDTSPDELARWVASEFARTGRYVRISDEQYLQLFESNIREPIRGGSSIGLDSMEFTAVSRKAFAKSLAVDISTVAKWINKGMPVLLDGYIPDAAHGWVERYRNKIREARSFGRTEGVNWEFT